MMTVAFAVETIVHVQIVQALQMALLMKIIVMYVTLMLPMTVYKIVQVHGVAV